MENENQLRETIARLTTELTDARNEAQAFKTQLVESQKMASLGELTGGVAHEIQNPLNFVNNFSEVCSELAWEIHNELDRGNVSEAKAIANELKDNLDKITHHGKRADGIVKAMLMHSKLHADSREDTNINVLADEYLRLAYHGLRAKDKSFHATLETDFDESIPLVSVFPQDVGRAILNLITNALYAVTERRKQLASEAYEPIISIYTKKCDEHIELQVIDNGNGIPPEVLDKIFQPFFTTKPSGQGTGLGLSLAFDIIKKHSGELLVETEHGEGSTFIIKMPF